MKNLRPLSLLLVLALLAVAGAAARAGRGSRRALHMASTPGADAPDASRTGARRYTLDLRSALQMSARSSAQREDVTFRLRGALAVTPVSVDDRGAVLAHHLTAVRFEVSRDGRSALTPAAAELLERQLGAPFYVDREPDGRVRAIRLPTGIDPLVAGTLRYLVTAAQFVRPAHAPPERWRLREVGAAGSCLAEYRRLGDRRYEKVSSQWTRLDASGRPARDAAEARIEGDARARVTLSGDGELDALDSEDTLGTSGGGGVLARTTSAVTLRRVATDLAPPGDVVVAEHLARWRGLHATRLHAFDGTPAFAVERDRRVVAGASLATLRASVPEDASTEAGGAAAASALQRIAALLRLDGRAVGEARGAVLSGVRDQESAALVAALGSVGSAPCQRALADIAEAVGAPLAARTRAVQALGLVEHPDGATVVALQRIAERGDDPELRESATLALGAASNAARDDGSPLADSAFEALAARLARAADAREAEVILDAMGNTGDPRVLDVVRDLLAHPSDAVREAAVAAARLVQTPGGDAFVAAQMRQSDDLALRVGAVRAAAFRALEPLREALGAALAADAQTSLRARTVSMLGGRVRDSAMAAEFLLRVAESDPDADVREAARAWLHQRDGA